jgi:hypothetical protein
MMILFLLLHFAIGALTSAATPEPGATYALVVAGISKDPDDRAVRNQALNDLGGYLLKQMKVDPRRLTVLAAHGSEAPTAARLSEAMGAFASAIRPEDRFIFYYMGQANIVGDELRLNLPGPDVTQKDLADRLNAIKTHIQLVVLDCPCAALAAKTLTAQNRIIVCASTATQPYGTRFTPHLLQALTQPQTDADGDGKVSLLEAFTAAAREIEQWYRQNAILPTETPCLEDDGDGAPGERPWKHQTEGGDGLKASTFLLNEAPRI